MSKRELEIRRNSENPGGGDTGGGGGGSPTPKPTPKSEVTFNISSTIDGGGFGNNKTAYVKIGDGSFDKITNGTTPVTFTQIETKLSTPHVFRVDGGYASDRYRVRLFTRTQILEKIPDPDFQERIPGSKELYFDFDQNKYNSLINDGYRQVKSDNENELKLVKNVLSIEAAVEVRNDASTANYKPFKQIDLPTNDIVNLPIGIYIDDGSGDSGDEKGEEFTIDVNFEQKILNQSIIDYEIIDGEVLRKATQSNPTLRVKVTALKTKLKLFSVSKNTADKYEIKYTLTNVRTNSGRVFNSVGSGDYKLISSFLPREFGLSHKNVDVNIDLRKLEDRPDDSDDPDDPDVPDTPQPPTLTITSNKDSVFNIQDKQIKIGYATDGDTVYASLAGTTTTHSANSPLTLTESNFKNGLGTYKLKLTPFDEFRGTGAPDYATIQVINEFNVPEPDITEIEFPKVIDGEDFVKFDVDFDVNWTSVNTTYVNLYIDSTDSESLIAKKSPANGKVRLNVAEILKKSSKGYADTSDVVNFDIFLIPYNSYGDTGRTEKIKIEFRQGLQLRRNDVISSIREAFERKLERSIFDEGTSEFLTHNLHLGKGHNKLISTWAIDTETFSEFASRSDTGEVYKTKENRTLVLKLYEPLDDEIEENDKIWISKIQSIPIVEQITLVGTDGETECVTLSPNFSLDFGEAVGYEILDELVASGSTTSTDLVNTFVSKSEFSLEDLHFNFTTGSDINWEEFVKYSSAEERINNFFYKVKVIENYDNKYSSSLSTPSGSLEVDLEGRNSLTKKHEIINSFDKFEKFLYESSSQDGITYPKINDTGSYLSTTSSLADQWFNTTITSAKEYDKNNYNSLVNNLPNHIVLDNNGQEFVLFFNMIGQHFDNIYSYIQGVNKNRIVEHKIDKGINDRMIYHMLQSLGWNANYGVEGQVLWEYAFGVDREGGNKQKLTGKQRQEEIWRRILNNLPYLLKHKGTKNSLSAILSIYGIPNSLLTILEFGGPSDVTSDATKIFSFEDRTAAINLDGTGSLSIPWNSYSSSLSNDYPLGIEMRVFSQNSIRQTLIENEGNWYLDVVPGTGSLATLEFGIVSGSSYISSSTSPIPFYNDEFTQIVLNKSNFSSGSKFEVIVKEGFQERIRNEVSSSLTVESTGSWNSGSELLIGSSSRGSFKGQLDEFRLWRVPLDELSIENHTLMPEAIDGQSYSSSIDDLLLRNDFEYPNNLATSGSVIPSGSVKNVSINRNYGVNFISASNFTGINTYPYNYTVYDRTVTAKVPSTGITYNNKFRFEDSYDLQGKKITDNFGVDLSVKQRKTKREFDQANIDENKLGLLFSPTKEINMNILKSLGSFNLDDYIGNPDDRYAETYNELDRFRNYYFDRFNLNLYEYINIVRLIEKTLFDTLESLVPARAKVAKGLLIEPHMLERNKVAWKRAEALRGDIDSVIDTQEFILATSSFDDFNAVLNAERAVDLLTTLNNYETSLDGSPDIELNYTIPMFNTEINDTHQYSLDSSIQRNSGSTMGGFEVDIDAQFTGSLQAEYFNRALIQVGNDSLSNLGFGLYGENGNSIRTYYDIFGNYKKERIKAFKIRRMKLVRTPVETSGSIDIIQLPEYSTEVSILPFTGSNGSESIDLTTGGDIVSVTPLNGYFQTHYKFVGDLTTGLKRSYHYGSKQTSETTLDGGAPVETFITNPNQLKVTEGGRGSGEPILIVPGEQGND